MGSPVSPIVANIYMEVFEQSHQHCTHTTKDEFFQHITTLDTSIQFTVEEAGPDGSIPFLDILVTPQSDGTFTTKVYRKPTHTDLYLQWDSNHNLASKYSVINTLTQSQDHMFHTRIVE